MNRPHLSVVFFQVQHATFSHLGSQNVREGAFSLSHGDVENPGGEVKGHVVAVTTAVSPPNAG